MALQWLAAELVTGRVIADLPSFDPQWPLKRTVSSIDTATGVLHLDGAPQNWERAVEEGNTFLACYDDTPAIDGSTPNPVVWMGVVWRTERAGHSDDVTVDMASWESIMDDNYVGDVTYTTAQHRDDILADLASTWLVTGMGVTCLQLAYTPGGGPTPPLMDSPPTANAAIILQNADNASVFARFQQVAGQLGGEFTISGQLSVDGQSVVPTLRFGDRIGAAAPAGLGPAVTFELPGSLLAFTQGRDYSRGKGANKVVPYSTGQGDVTPFGAAATAARAGRPVFEYRYQPGSSLSPAALGAYGRQAIAVLGPGARPVALTASLAGLRRGSRLGVDWFLGDDVGYAVGLDGTVPAFPRGLSGVGRAISYELTDSTVTPVLADAAVYSQPGA